MGAKIVWTCDGCGTSIQDVDVKETNDVAMVYAKAQEQEYQLLRSVHPEVYCGNCRVRACEFWKAKEQAITNCSKEMQGRIENHRKRFWQGGAKTNVVTMGVK